MFRITPGHSLDPDSLSGLRSKRAWQGRNAFRDDKSASYRIDKLDVKVTILFDPGICYGARDCDVSVLRMPYRESVERNTPICSALHEKGKDHHEHKGLSPI